VRSFEGDPSLYLCGSVATGTARPVRSDVDLLSIGLEGDAAKVVGETLPAEFSAVCRGVEVAPVRRAGYEGASDGSYGNRVFLRHYRVHLAGPDPRAALADFPADRAAARGFNGDIGGHADRWLRALAEAADPGCLGRRIARKTLLAVAGLVSVHDDTWTTDRRGAQRWGEIDPGIGRPNGVRAQYRSKRSRPARSWAATRTEPSRLNPPVPRQRSMSSASARVSSPRRTYSRRMRRCTSGVRLRAVSASRRRAG